MKRRPRSPLVPLMALLLPALAACEALTGGADVPGTDAPAAPSFQSLYDRYLFRCAGCHAPEAPGRTSETEASLDFSTADTAWSTLTGGVATGLVGNQEACNGVPFLGDTYGDSMLAAVMDEDVRAAFSRAGAGGPCDADALSDMTIKTQYPVPAGFLADLEAWIAAGAGR